MAKALIFGAAGQDGAYLSRSLLDDGYEIIGIEKSFNFDLWRFRAVGIENNPKMKLVECDIADSTACSGLLHSYKPDEIYNFAAQSSVALSFKDPAGTVLPTAFGASTLFEAVRQNCPDACLFQASSADMFGMHNGEDYKNEASPYFPKSPYAVSKVFAHQLAKCYRESYGLNFSCGILFNHESPLRTEAFVTKKIAAAAARISQGSEEILELGNMDALRDWGYAPEYVEAMRLMLKQPQGDDFVIATGKLTSVREFVEACFAAVNMELDWHGSGVDEKGYRCSDGRLLVSVNPGFFRPIEAEPYGGDPSKIKRLLGWEAKTNLQELCMLMVTCR